MRTWADRGRTTIREAGTFNVKHMLQHVHNLQGRQKNVCMFVFLQRRRATIAWPSHVAGWSSSRDLHMQWGILECINVKDASSSYPATNVYGLVNNTRPCA
jgi:hypothetical protein